MDWTRGRTIGSGSSGTVSIAKGHRSGEVFAVKSAELSKSEFLKREQRILSTVNCPEIVGYKGFNVTNENGKELYNLCMEFATGGSVTDEIRRCGGRIDEATIRSYTRRILIGLLYLHSNGIVHCDVKGSNVLITGDGVKIGDLGCAKYVDDVSSSDSSLLLSQPPAQIAGTPLFMAPEVARGEEQGYPADIWALGCTMIEMATGRAPWISGVSDPVSALYRIGFSGEVLEIPSFLSKQAKDFLSKCLKRDPLERWSASELLDHAFLEKSELVSNSDTPTSVLDHTIWESKEEPETTTRNSTQMSNSDSPMDRIRQLTGGDKATSLSTTDWGWDENWVTVRSNDVKEVGEVFSCSQDNESSTSSERVGSLDSQYYNSISKMLIISSHSSQNLVVATADMNYRMKQILIGVSDDNEFWDEDDEINSIVCLLNHSDTRRGNACNASNVCNCNLIHRIISSLLGGSTCKTSDDFYGNQCFGIKESFSTFVLCHCEWFFTFLVLYYPTGLPMKWAWAFILVSYNEFLHPYIVHPIILLAHQKDTKQTQSLCPTIKSKHKSMLHAIR